MSTQIDEVKLEALGGKVLGDVAGAMGVLLAYIGDQAGVYAALEAAGRCSADALASRLGLNPKYVHEWLSSNAANGYVTHHPETGEFSLTPEQALLFAHEGDPACMQGFFQAVVAQFETHQKAVETFRSGKGRSWGDHSACTFCGTDRFFRPGYEANLLSSWIPALDGVESKLKAGAKVADIGCGHGSSTILMAKAFPSSVFHGFDFHAPSIEEARKKARDAGVSNVEFFVTSAKDYPGTDYDLACIFDALHDMGDPVGAAAHIRATLKPDGAFMLVEPLAGDTVADNLHALGACYYAFSTVLCTPTSLAQEVGLGLGTQAGQRRLTQVLNQAGFPTVRRAAETATNMVLEARPH
ncbi:MAG TPA: SAM-dependent methyltransferase [Alphaproteobacteria bacterium]|nr:SAM-dependent methyltransferase [Alphaproteobacteria bacterium]HAJ45186.1 SAM-dependent methyltransferase [Alphaproteobacteria bacterium]